MSVLPRTAVVIVHGIGEQQPLSTLLNFVGQNGEEGGLLADEEDRLHRFVNPDTASRRTYLRRITFDHTHRVRMDVPTPQGISAKRYSRTTHFYEYYWAYRFRGTTWRHLNSLLPKLTTIDRSKVTNRNLLGLGGPARIGYLAGVLVSLGFQGALVAAIVATASPSPPSFLEWWGGSVQWGAFIMAALAAVSALLFAGPCGLITWIRTVLAVILATVLGWLGGLGVTMNLDIVHWLSLGTGLGALALTGVWVTRGLGKSWVGGGAIVGVIGVGWAMWGESSELSAAVASAKAVAATGAALLLPLLGGVALRGVGDAARYLSNKPDDITDREKIRTGLIELLRELHERRDVVTGRFVYERIVLVGHSLGSVIAYDAVQALWAETNQSLAFPQPTTERSAPVTRLVEALEADEFACPAEHPEPTEPCPSTRECCQEFSTDTARRWRHAQRELQAALRAEVRLDRRTETSGEKAWTFRSAKDRWIISDLVTVGSPLTYAEVLLAPGVEGVRRARRSRLLSSCPPVRQTTQEDTPFRYRSWLGSKKGYTTKLHHASVFAVTTWTNLYFPKDLVGGPLTPHFGPGVCDVPVTEEAGTSATVAGFLTARPHSSYWGAVKAANKRGTERSLEVLRYLIVQPHVCLVAVGSQQQVGRLHNSLAQLSRAGSPVPHGVQLENAPGTNLTFPHSCGDVFELRVLRSKRPDPEGEAESHKQARREAVGGGTDRRPENPDPRPAKREWVWVPHSTLYCLCQLPDVVEAAGAMTLTLAPGFGGLGPDTDAERDPETPTSSDGEA